MNRMASFKQIERSKEILGLDEYATLQEIKNSYRNLAAKHHPDRCSRAKLKKCEKRIREINNAKDVLLNYCNNYRYSFKEIDVRRSSFGKEEYDYLKKFYDGWIVDL